MPSRCRPGRRARSRAQRSARRVAAARQEVAGAWCGAGCRGEVHTRRRHAWRRCEAARAREARARALRTPPQWRRVGARAAGHRLWPPPRRAGRAALTPWGPSRGRRAAAAVRCLRGVARGMAPATHREPAAAPRRSPRATTGGPPPWPPPQHTPGTRSRTAARRCPPPLLLPPPPPPRRRTSRGTTARSRSSAPQ
eukprot:scaffold14943_cov48-Phaeocystis_antarctica.AAC.1